MLPLSPLPATPLSPRSLHTYTPHLSRGPDRPFRYGNLGKFRQICAYVESSVTHGSTRGCRAGRTIRSPAGRRVGARCRTGNDSGRTLAISDFISDREFRRRGLYAEVCRPLGVRAMMKVYLPTGASLVFDTTRTRFAESDRLTLQRLVPHLAQLRRNALVRRTYPALIDSTAAARMRLLRLTPRERVVLARAAAGETNTVIAAALFRQPRDRPQAPGTHLRQARSPHPDRSGRDLHPRASGHREPGWTSRNAQTLPEPAASGQVNLKGIDRRSRWPGPCVPGPASHNQPAGEQCRALQTFRFRNQDPGAYYFPPHRPLLGE
jgi:hypothetical protein